MSLFALIFSIGILVDDAIVVVENIHRWQQLEPQKPLWQLIPKAVDEVGGPTILATFTVIAALLPMAFVTGLMGPYMSPIPINSSMGMFISLAVAFVVTPWLAQKMLKPAERASPRGRGQAHQASRRLLPAHHEPLARPATRRAGRGVLWLGGGADRRLGVARRGRAGGAQDAALRQQVGVQVVLDMPQGTPLEETNRVLHEIGDYLAEVPEVTDYQTYAGTAAPINFNGLVRQYYLRSSPEMGDIQINLVDKHHRDRKSHEVAAAVRDEVMSIARRSGGNAKVVEVPPGPPVLSPIVAEVTAPTMPARSRLRRRCAKPSRARPTFLASMIRSMRRRPSVVLQVSQAKAALMGVSQADIVAVVRLGLAGEDVTPVHGGDNKYEIPVRIQLPANSQSSVETLLKLKVRSRDGRLVPVSELVEVRPTTRDQVLYRKDLLPVVYVTGDMGGELDSPLYGMFAIRAKLNELPLVGEHLAGTLGEWFIRQPDDPYAAYSVKWDGEWQITYDTFRDMGIAYGVGLILIYLLVVAQFRSYLAPLIIMAPIPLTIIGVMPGHALLGAQFTATSMIGMIALAGIIVRNSILLVDFINHQVGEGIAFAEAVIRAAAVRASRSA